MTRRLFPGKLFLLGEYFVTKNYNQGIIMAVDRFITTQTKKSEKFKLMTDYGIIDENHTNDEKMHIAKEAVQLAYDYLQSVNRERVPLKIIVESSLLENNRKIGLGSSGVIIVALLTSILESHNVYLSKIKIFKLAVLCQRRLDNYSSGGDLAASIYGGIIYYQKYDHDWLMDQPFSFSLIKEKWPGLTIELTDVFDDYEILVGWTQQENDTSSYLQVFNRKINVDKRKYNALDLQARKSFDLLLSNDVLKSIRLYREIMLKLQEWTGLDIETERLARGIKVVSDHGGEAKISGSGGGDCLIALIHPDNLTIKENIITEWRKYNIIDLDIGVWNNESITKKR